jgi:RNA polymerase sigma-70 factor (ECF subfamily)
VAAWSLGRSRHPDHPDDAALVGRLRAGEEAAFEEFFDRSFHGLVRFAVARLGGDHELAKEMAQAAICRAFEKLDTFRGEAPLFAWVCAICRFEISAHFRRERREPPRAELPEEGVEVPAAVETLSFELADPQSQALRREVARRVHRTIDHLPHRYAQVLEWRYDERLAVDEIAGRLELSYKAAESLLSRARQAFRDGFSSPFAERAPEPAESGGEP